MDNLGRRVVRAGLVNLPAALRAKMSGHALLVLWCPRERRIQRRGGVRLNRQHVAWVDRTRYGVRLAWPRERLSIHRPDWPDFEGSPTTAITTTTAVTVATLRAKFKGIPAAVIKRLRVNLKRRWRPVERLSERRMRRRKRFRLRTNRTRPNCRERWKERL